MSVCIFCGRSVAILLSFSFIFSTKKFKAPLLCTNCSSKFQQIDVAHACSGCFRSQANSSLCLDCHRWEQEYPVFKQSHQALFQYNEIAKEYMKGFKFQGDIVLADLFAIELSKVLVSYQKTHHIVPIPISKESMDTRGFNQVSLMLERAGVRYINLLDHKGVEDRQATKNRKNRLLTPQCFRVNPNVLVDELLTKPVLIIDDIYTTGRTIMHAKEAIHSFKIGVENQEANQSIEIASLSLFR